MVFEGTTFYLFQDNLFDFFVEFGMFSRSLCIFNLFLKTSLVFICGCELVTHKNKLMKITSKLVAFWIEH